MDCSFTATTKMCWPTLLANGFRGIVKLIYINPPFDSGADYVRRVELRRIKAAKFEGEGYELGSKSSIQTYGQMIIIFNLCLRDYRS